MEQRRGLVEAFGNKSSKKIARTQQENRVQTISGASTIVQTLEKKMEQSSTSQLAMGHAGKVSMIQKSFIMSIFGAYMSSCQLLQW